MTIEPRIGSSNLSPTKSLDLDNAVPSADGHSVGVNQNPVTVVGSCAGKGRNFLTRLMDRIVSLFHKKEESASKSMSEGHRNGICYFMHGQRSPGDLTPYNEEFLDGILKKYTLEGILAEVDNLRALNGQEKAEDWKPEFAEKFKEEIVKKYFENPSAVKTEKYKEEVVSWAGEMEDSDFYKLSKNFDRSNLPDKIFNKLNKSEEDIFKTDESLVAFIKDTFEKLPPTALKRYERLCVKKGDTDFLTFAAKVKDWTKLPEGAQKRLQEIFDKAYSNGDAETLDKVYATMDDVHFFGNLNPKEVPNLPDGAMNRLKIYFATLPEDQFLPACVQFGPENLPEGAKRKYDRLSKNVPTSEISKTESTKPFDVGSSNNNLINTGVVHAGSPVPQPPAAVQPVVPAETIETDESTPPPPVPRGGFDFLDGDVGGYGYAPGTLEKVRAMKTANQTAAKVEEPEATNPVPQETAEKSRMGTPRNLRSVVTHKQNLSSVNPR